MRRSEARGSILLIVSIATVLVSMLMPSVARNGGAEINHPSCQNRNCTYTGTWVIEDGDNVLMEDVLISGKGDLLVKGGGVLTFRNVTLVIENFMAPQWSLVVESGGTFVVQDGGDGLAPTDTHDSDASVIEGRGLGRTLVFQVRRGASLVIDRSIVTGCGETILPLPGKLSFSRDGLHIESDNVTVSESVFKDNNIGIIVNRSSPRLENSTFASNGIGMAIVGGGSLRASGVRVENNSLEGVYVSESSLVLTKSSIKRNGLGPFVRPGIAVVDGVSLQSVNSDISMNRGSGIESEGASVFIEGSSIVDNGLNLQGLAGAYVANGSASFIDNVLKGNGDFGVRLLDERSSGMDAQIVGNSIESHQVAGISIHTASSLSAEISRNTVSDSGSDGIVADSDGDLVFVVRDNAVDSAGRYGLAVQAGGSCMATFERNRVLRGGSASGVLTSREKCAVSFNGDVFAGSQEGQGLRLQGVNATMKGVKALVNGGANLLVHNSQVRILESDFSLGRSGVLVENNSMVSIVNSTLTSTAEDMSLSGGSQVTAINVDFDKNSAHFADGASKLTVSWFASMEVTTDGGLPLPSATLTAKDSEGLVNTLRPTNANGESLWNVLTECVITRSGESRRTPHEITASHSKYGSVTASVSMDSNRFVTLVMKDLVTPVARADPQTVNEDSLVVLDGTGSTDNQLIVNYTWSFSDGGRRVALYGAIVTYRFADPGVVEVTLTVADASGNKGSVTVPITVLDVTPPSAHAGADRTVNEDTIVVLDGTLSTDNVAIVSFDWRIYGGYLDARVQGENVTVNVSEPGKYVIVLEARDAAGNIGMDIAFLTVLDITPPRVVYSIPRPFEQSVNPDSEMAVRFSEPMNTTSVETTLRLQGFDASAEWRDSGRLLILRPRGGMGYGSAFSITIEESATDLAGNRLEEAYIVSFSTLDVTPPIARAGADRTVNEDTTVVLDGTLSTDNVAIVSFEWRISGGSLDARLQGERVAINVSEPGKYVIVLEVRDVAGNVGVDVAFLTVLDITPPTVLYSVPAPLQQNVDVGSEIVVRFSEPMNTTSVETTLRLQGFDASAEWRDSGRLLILRPRGGMGYGSAFSITIEESATDLAGNRLEEAYIVSFSTAAQSQRSETWWPFVAVAGVAVALIAVAILLKRRGLRRPRRKKPKPPRKSASQQFESEFDIP